MSAVLTAEEPNVAYFDTHGPRTLDGFELLATAAGGAARLRALVVSLAVAGRLPSKDLGSSQVSGAAWPVVSLSDLCQSFQNGASSRGDVGGVPTTVIRLADIIAGEINPVDPRVLPIRAADRAKYELRQGDILVIRVNGSAELVGRFIVCRSDIDAIPCDHFIRMRFDTSVVSPEYLRLVGDSAGVRARVAALFVSTAGQKTVNQGHVGSITMALPPLAEQHRIVARVEELMKLCDALEQSGRLADEQHARLTSTLFDALAASESAHSLAENWQRIAEHFDLLCDRPEAIDTLEQVILDLAVRGRLVPQDGLEEPAIELLMRVRKEKDRLISDGRVPRDKGAPAITEDELPYELPAGWAWVRLGQLLSKIGAGSTPLGGRDVYTTTGVKFLRSQNVWNDGLRLAGVALIPSSTHSAMSGTVVQARDLLFNITGASIGRCAVVPADFDEANVSQHVTIVRPVIAATRHFLHLVLVSKHVQQNVRDVQVGVSREGLSIAKLRNFVVPVPPLAEQHRIVARVEELRHLCANLRQRLVQARETQSRLAGALVAEVS